MLRLSLLLLLCLLYTGCSCASSEGLRVVVKFPANSKSRCTQVVLLGGTEVTSTAVDRQQGKELHVGILRAAGMSKELRLVARGYAATPKCAGLGPVLESSDEVLATFSTDPASMPVELTLKTPVVTATDMDGDGFNGLASGGP